MPVLWIRPLYMIWKDQIFEFCHSAAEIIVTYDPNKVGFDKFSELTLKIGDETYATTYGLSQYTVKVGIPSPWETLGKGIFIGNF